MGFSTTIYLVDIESVQDVDTGRRHLQIVNETKVYADDQETGLQEFYSASSLKIEIIGVLEIPKHMYNNQKYILDNTRTKQYEITRVAKGHSRSYLRLPYIKVKDNKMVITNG